jgi:ActR/RegA family two-component response regulator
MASQALVLSIDPHSSQLVRGVLNEFGLKADLCLSTNSARRLLKQNRYESVIVDCDSVADGLSIFADLRQNRENRSAVTVTLLRDAMQMRKATEVGSTFMLHKPVPAEDARRIIRIARHLLTREAVRQYMRLPLTDLAFALLNDEQQILIENVSAGGMAIQAEELLEVGSECRVRFTLPGQAEIAAEAKIKWSDASGRAGLQFTQMEQEARERLTDWIERSHQAGLPDIDGNRRVVLDIPAKMSQTRPWARRAAAVLSAITVDFAMASSATATFALMARASAGEFLPWKSLILPTLLFAAAYHYVFVAHGKSTPGFELAQRVKGTD